MEFVPLRASARFPALQTRRIDLLLSSTTWTLTREAVLKVQFPGILFYDGQGFMVPAAADIATLADLAVGICAARGQRVSFIQFLRIGLPIAAMQLSVGALYIWALSSILD